MLSSNARARFEELKKQILELGFVRPGSLVRRYMPCGNPSCRCMGSRLQLHRPYSQWSYKIAGKTRTIRLSEEQVRLCRECVRNHKRLKSLLWQMEQLSLRETDR